MKARSVTVWLAAAENVSKAARENNDISAAWHI